MAAPVLSPAVVSVTVLDGQETLTLSFSMSGRQHKMLRPQQEPLERTLRRIALTTAKKKNKKGRHDRDAGAQQPETAPVVRLMKEREAVPGSTLNLQAWQEGEELMVGEERFVVLVNHPAVKSLSVSACVMAGGYPVVPEVELQFSELACCKWTWKRLSIDGSSSSIVSSSMVYWTTEDDTGHRLVLECVPYNTAGRGGEPFSVTSGPVLSPPNVSAILIRHQLTPHCLCLSEELRVVSYNILADQYSSTDHAQQVLYPYCQPKALAIGYRQCLLAMELHGYHADILCLQEVGKKCFDRFLLPAMRDCGYDGWLALKTGQVQEGEATLFRSSKYQLVSSSTVDLTQFLMEDTSCSELYSALQKAPTVISDLKNIMHTILQVSILQSINCPFRYLCVANTHLYFHPAADHIRLIQAVVCVKTLHKAKESFIVSTASSTLPQHSSSHQPEVAVIFCGDFNSCPCIGAYQFLTKGSVEQDHPDWTKYKLGLIPKCGCSSVPENESDYIPSMHLRKLMHTVKEQLLSVSDSGENISAPNLCAEISDEFTGLDVSHPFSLQDACGSHLLLPYTNFTLGFKCVLDYIFIDSINLSATSAVPLPAHNVLTENVALPSVSFPSDHLALITDLRWKNQLVKNT